ncbi:hypothetical protein Tco_0657731, partial [Tanacetum coccineum]
MNSKWTTTNMIRYTPAALMPIDEEEVSSDDNEMVEVKVIMALAEENDDVNKEGARNGEWVKISMRKVLVCKTCERTDHRTCDHAEYISTMNMSQHLKSLGRMSSRPNIPRPSKRLFPPCIYCGAYGSPNHTTTNHYDIEWFKRDEALQAKKAEALKSTRAESSNANRSKTLTK